MTDEDQAISSTPDLFEQAKAVLEMNDQGTHTVPAEGLYPHQWLWDSCFIAIGLRHLDVERAQTEIFSLLQGQWSNGMLPNMIFNAGREYRHGHNVWRSWLNPYSPDDATTTGITQPPMLAEAVVRVGEKLKIGERRSWYKTVFPALLAYHEWLYAERDPHHEGLVLQIHPWETGLDNTPPWIKELHEHQLPLWITVIAKLRLLWLGNFFRRDTHYVPAAHRLATLDALAFFSTQRRLRRKNYDIDRILRHSLFSIEDLSFNCIFIRANQHLKAIAKTLRTDLPDTLTESMSKTESALEELWDPYAGQYYSRNFVTHKLLKEPSIATLMPLYAGCLNPERAAQLVKLLENKHLFGPAYPVPSVPANSAWFNPVAYWQGPTWVNTNWLIIDGLKRSGYKDHAAALTESTLELVQNGGCNEYFDPLTGEPAGAPNFSWTAALTVDLLRSIR